MKNTIPLWQVDFRDVCGRVLTFRARDKERVLLLIERKMRRHRQEV